ncbi:tRNA (adenosine(37)-N6)-threonylcarbamoyltransferase complex dimerization subunit type 1 TsaB [Lacipirellula limnantheis]|uniref:tRNA threonylcarbamoyladenosine biosynthesis protein TsaB n=1 Tax=Lacipirellula limnantheis TaxID=2528024 RepID=A0A517TX32_9BACT|nr:tRNA (adenosine(37)-N6)-threonylcarbamoyltransferase complex dimerization subunit type 1 TsaB [Lacipirellula limnantheis]QDT72936.1 tRNA threonylcarbamoyladenosine biosynthesis protein TsaB [Lacipirellula limnantheis]
MKTLAFETSGLLGSVALLETVNGKLVSTIERETPADQRTARSLLPTTHELLKESGWRPADIELVAVSTGPGSFTGLRIGVVAAKTFAYAVGAKLVGVHTLAAMAEPLAERPSRVWSILDAQRQELFAASFDPARSIIDQAEPSTDVTPIDVWLPRLATGDQVIGPPLAKLAQSLPAGVSVADQRLWNPTAAAVARLGIALFQRGGEISPLELVPDYFRKSAAEEKAEAALGL